jgi:hypothetical protein
VSRTRTATSSFHGHHDRALPIQEDRRQNFFVLGREEQGATAQEGAELPYMSVEIV